MAVFIVDNFSWSNHGVACVTLCYMDLGVGPYHGESPWHSD